MLKFFVYLNLWTEVLISDSGIDSFFTYWQGNCEYNLLMQAFNPYPLFSDLKCHLLFMSAAYIKVHFRLDFSMEEKKTMNPYQTAPLGAFWFRSILFVILTIK